MQSYMHLAGLERAFYLAVNKNTDELYQERIRYDAEADSAAENERSRTQATMGNALWHARTE